MQHCVKRIHTREYCGSSDSTFLQDLKELPPLHPSEVETVLRKKETASQSFPRKGEPIFPPPPDPSCTVSARSVVTSCKSSTSNFQQIRKVSQSFNHIGSSLEKYSVPAASSVANFSQIMRPSGIAPTLPPDSYPYLDLRSKCEPEFYQGASNYDPFSLPGFSNEYSSFNSYGRFTGYPSWSTLGKHEQSIPNRPAQGPSSIPSSDSSSFYRAFSTTSCLDNSPGFTTNLPFNQSFQNENMHGLHTYSSSVEAQQSGYGINLPTYNYPPPNTTSYM